MIYFVIIVLSGQPIRSSVGSDALTSVHIKA